MIGNTDRPAFFDQKNIETSGLKHRAARDIADAKHQTL